MGIKCFMIEPCNVREDGNAYSCDWRRVDTGEIVCQGYTAIPFQPPVGAMWWSDIVSDYRPSGPADYLPSRPPESRTKPAQPSSIFGSGLHLTVMTPGGEWNIDSRASNCTMPYDYGHRCWVRHGEPPHVTVNKSGGPTCQAGAGSIQCGNYHGFLIGGELT